MEGLLVLFKKIETPMERKNQCLPVITVGKLHVHAMATQEGLAVQGDIDV